MLTPKEYKGWIEYVKKDHFPIADTLVHDINNWRNRSVLARALVRAEQYAPAIELYKSIVDVEIHTEEKDCLSLSEVEDKVWCLQELALSLWRTTGDRHAALKYMEEALKLIEEYPKQFNYMNRCEVWKQIQDFIFFTSKGKSRK